MIKAGAGFEKILSIIPRVGLRYPGTSVRFRFLRRLPKKEGNDRRSPSRSNKKAGQ